MIRVARRFSLLLALAVAAGMSGDTLAQDASVAETKADIAETLGENSVFLEMMPEIGMAAAWSQYRAWYIDQKSTIPQKYRALIGLAVSSQIPCAYCIYADTSDAKVFGATDEEIKEAVAMAAVTRQWSTMLNGMQVDMAAFRKEIDEGAAAMREAINTQRKAPKQ